MIDKYKKKLEESAGLRRDYKVIPALHSKRSWQDGG